MYSNFCSNQKCLSPLVLINNSTREEVALMTWEWPSDSMYQVAILCNGTRWAENLVEKHWHVKACACGNLTPAARWTYGERLAKEKKDEAADTERVETDAELLLTQYDRCLSGCIGAFGRVDDAERIGAMVRAAGKAGVTLFWLKSVWAMGDIGLTTSAQQIEDYYQRIPWAAPKHVDWRVKYKLGWNYDFAADEWIMPSDFF